MAWIIVQSFIYWAHKTAASRIFLENLGLDPDYYIFFVRCKQLFPNVIKFFRNGSTYVVVICFLLQENLEVWTFWNCHQEGNLCLQKLFLSVSQYTDVTSGVTRRNLSWQFSVPLLDGLFRCRWGGHWGTGSSLDLNFGLAFYCLRRPMSKKTWYDYLAAWRSWCVFSPKIH